jgi:hypothetical protein
MVMVSATMGTTVFCTRTVSPRAGAAHANAAAQAYMISELCLECFIAKFA